MNSYYYQALSLLELELKLKEQLLYLLNVEDTSTLTDSMLNKLKPVISSNIKIIRICHAIWIKPLHNSINLPHYSAIQFAWNNKQDFHSAMDNYDNTYIKLVL